MLTSSLLAENTELKKRLREIEQERRAVGYEQTSQKDIASSSNLLKI